MMNPPYWGTTMLDYVVDRYQQDRVDWPNSSQAALWVTLTERMFESLMREIELLPPEYPRPIIRIQHRPGIRAERLHRWQVQFPARWIREWASTQRGVSPKG